MWFASFFEQTMKLAARISVNEKAKDREENQIRLWPAWVRFQDATPASQYIRCVDFESLVRLQVSLEVSTSRSRRSSHTETMARSAGVIPEIRPACPKVAGLIWASLVWASFFSPRMVA
jgi:hypothetical protein